MASPCVVTLLFWASQFSEFLRVRVPQAVLLFTFSSQVFLLFNYSGSQSAVNMCYLCYVGTSVETIGSFC